jgi:methyltransferase (TIGR00027 family)
MIRGQPSLTAQRVAFSRAAHQLLDAAPLVLEDPVALPLLGRDSASQVRAQRLALQTPPARALRAFLVARSRIAEDALAAAVAAGVRQYVVLGAGLDTFAYRNPFAAEALTVFEVDHPATQAWKQSLLQQAQIHVPAAVRYVATDFEQQSLAQQLAAASFDNNRPAWVSWLGVSMYLTPHAVAETLSFIASLPPGSGVVFDYAVPPAAVSAPQRIAYRARLLRVAAAGEPWRSLYRPHELAALLEQLGLRKHQDLGHEELNARFFSGRSDGLTLRGPGRLLCASR